MIVLYHPSTIFLFFLLGERYEYNIAALVGGGWGMSFFFCITFCSIPMRTRRGR